MRPLAWSHFSIWCTLDHINWCCSVLLARMSPIRLRRLANIGIWRNYRTQTHIRCLHENHFPISFVLFPRKMRSMHRGWLSYAHSIGRELVWYHHPPLPSRFRSVLQVWSRLFTYFSHSRDDLPEWTTLLTATQSFGSRHGLGKYHRVGDAKLCFGRQRGPEKTTRKRRANYLGQFQRVLGSQGFLRSVPLRNVWAIVSMADNGNLLTKLVE